MFWCPVDRLRNWVETLADMQQEGVASVFLPRPASLVRASVLPCVEAPMSESTVLLVDAGAVPTGSAGAHVLGGGGRGWGWAEGQRLLCVCVWGGGGAILKRKACMGPGVGAQRRGPVPIRMSDENHQDCTGPP